MHTSPARPPFSDLERPPLNAAALRRALVEPPGMFGRLEVVESTGSTNDDLAAAVAAAPGEWPDLSVLTAEFQSAGSGRRGRTWSAPPRSSLAVSVLLRPESRPGAGAAPDPTASGWLPLLAGLAAVESLRQITGLNATLKWPNDVLVEVDGAERKLVGILGRAVVLPRAAHGERTDDGAMGAGAPETAFVLGSGINVTLTESELPVETATSVRLAGASVHDRDTILRAYLRRLAHWYGRFADAGLDAEGSGVAAGVREVSSTIGATVRADLPDDTSLTGEATGIDALGRLVVASGGAEVALSAADVVHLRKVAP